MSINWNFITNQLHLSCRAIWVSYCFYRDIFTLGYIWSCYNNVTKLGVIPIYLTGILYCTRPAADEWLVGKPSTISLLIRLTQTCILSGREMNSKLELLVCYHIQVAHTMKEGSSCPWAQQVWGHKTVSPEIFHD